MRKIDVLELFNRICKAEYELLKYINRIQSDRSAPINFYDAAEVLNAEKDEVRRRIKKLVDAGVLLVDGENFQINPEVYKKQ